MAFIIRGWSVLLAVISWTFQLSILGLSLTSSCANLITVYPYLESVGFKPPEFGIREIVPSMHPYIHVCHEILSWACNFSSGCESLITQDEQCWEGCPVRVCEWSGLFQNWPFTCLTKHQLSQITVHLAFCLLAFILWSHAKILTLLCAFHH